MSSPRYYLSVKQYNVQLDDNGDEVIVPSMIVYQELTLEEVESIRRWFKTPKVV